MSVEILEMSESGNSAFIGLGNTQGALLTTSQQKNQKTQTVEKQITSASSSISPWGDNNCFPSDVIKDCRASTVVPSTIEKMVRFLTTGGLVWGRVVGFDRFGNEMLEPSKGKEYLEIKKWLDRANINGFLEKAATDAYWFWNWFPVFVKNRAGDKIINLDLHRAWECRHGWQNEKTGLIENTYVSASWDRITSYGNLAENEYVKELPTVNSEWDAVAQIKQTNKKELVMPLSFPSVGSKYYQLAPWDSIRSGGWLELSKEIPKWKKAMMVNGIHPKFHLEIENGWWDWKYPGFKEKSPEEKKSIMNKELKTFFDVMSGSDKAGNTFISAFERDKHSGTEYSSWKFTPIDNKIKDGLFNSDSQEGSNHILYALGVDPTIVGNGPGKSMGAGSGSDKRVAYNIQVMNLKPQADKILQPLHIIRDVNGWDSNLQFWFKNQYIATLDTQKPAERI